MLTSFGSCFRPWVTTFRYKCSFPGVRWFLVSVKPEAVNLVTLCHRQLVLVESSDSSTSLGSIWICLLYRA